MAAQTHERARIDGVALHYAAAGPEDGDLVVLLHGFPESWYSWQELLPALAAEGHRVVAPDMRGYGESDAPRGVASYDLDALVDDVVGLMAHLGRSSAAVVGHDWGGIVAWEAAARRAEAVDRIAVLNAPHLGRYRELLAGRQLARSWYALAYQLPWLPEWALRRNDFAAVRALYRRALGDAVEAETVDRFVEALASPRSLTGALNYYRSLFRRLLAEEVARLTGRGAPDRRVPASTPALLVWGERDRALVVANTDGLDRWVPALRVERLPDVGHWPHLVAPERVRAPLVDFLDG